MKTTVENSAFLPPPPPQDIRLLFEGITNKTAADEQGNPYVQIRHGNELFHVGIASNLDELAEVKALDDRAFGIHQGISTEELSFLTKNGRVMMLRDETGQLVAESQIQLIPGNPGATFRDDEAYCYGTAVRPGLEGRGYAQVMYKAQEVTAREAGKRAMVGTVRVENAQSIRARLRAGFRIIGYDPNYYGSFEKGGARLIINKDLINEPLPFLPDRQSDRVFEGRIPIINGEEQRHILPWKPLEVAVSIEAGAVSDPAVHARIQAVVENGYVGTGFLRPEETDEGQSLAIFQSIDSFPIVDSLAHPLSVRSEYGKLREVIVSYPPENAQLSSANAINTVAQAHIGNIDSIAYKDEHLRFIQALESLGVHVVYTPALGRDQKNAIYTRDPGFTLGDTFVHGKLARETRRYEKEALRRLTRGINEVDFSRFAPPEAVAEMGDVIFLEDNKIAVGLNERTNLSGLHTLQVLFPQYAFVGVEHPDLHLDVLFTMVGPRKALADVTQLPYSFVKMLLDSGYKIVEADPNEQTTLGCNVLAVDSNVVVAAKQNTETNHALRENGVEVVEVDMPNITKEGGGPRCITCPTNRD